MERERHAGPEGRAAVEEGLHLGVVPSENDEEQLPLVFHLFDERDNSLIADL